MLPLLAPGAAKALIGPALKVALAVGLGLGIALAAKHAIDSWREDVAEVQRLSDATRRQSEILDDLRRAERARDEVARATADAVARLSARRAESAAVLESARDEIKRMAREAKANGESYCPTPAPIVYAIGQLRDGVPKAGADGGHQDRDAGARGPAHLVPAAAAPAH